MCYTAVILSLDMVHLLLAALVCNMVLGELSTANSFANDDTKKIYVLMSNLNGHMLSGAFGGYSNVGDSNGFSMAQAEDLHKLTSKYPAIYGIDCARGWDTTDPGKEADVVECMNPDIVDYAKKGGIITVSHHIPNPFYEGNNYNGSGAFKQQISDRDYTTILKDGSPARSRWLAILEKIAGGLQAYNERGLTVLYRPLHEMNGDWFWWGALPGDNSRRMHLFKLLWADLFNFMKQKGLNNLLWVYSPDNSRGYKTEFYPGGEFVDFVGLDFYTDDVNNLDGYDQLTALDKPFALAEVGPRSIDGNYDYGSFVNTVLRRFPKTAYFMPWNDNWSPLRNKGAAVAFNNPKIINLGELNLS